MGFKSYYLKSKMNEGLGDVFDTVGDYMFDNSQTVEIGDTVISDNFGAQKIVGMEKIKRGDRDGEPVDKLTLDVIQSDRAIIYLKNGHFLYGYQVKEIKKQKKKSIGTVGGLT